MERPFICDGSKYTISATNTIALPVSLDNLPSEIVINGNKLLLKSSFHVSLVCINQIIKKQNILTPDFKDLIVKDFCDFVAINDISLLSYIDEFRFVMENDLKTVIVRCNVLNLEKFFEILNKKYNLNLEYPPTHVTIYSSEPPRGTFLTDTADITNLTKLIPNPIGYSL